MFAGHGWAIWNGDMPIRALLFDEGLMSGPVESVLGIDWGPWVSSLDIGDRIDAAVRIQAWVFLLYAAAFLVPLRGRATAVICTAASLNLAFLAWLGYLDAGVGIGQLLEQAGQVALPLVLCLALCGGGCRGGRALASVAIAITFIAHGLFAINLQADLTWLNHPRPGKFTEMTMRCLGLGTEPAANRILVAAGILDFVVALLIFVPGLTRRLALGYMVAWGFLTALARPWAYFDAAESADSLNAWLPEALQRAPHFAIPLYLLLAAASKGEEASRPRSTTPP